ncbi:MAG: helix-turn-helix transcriptional regulator [Leptolyngbya sp. SIO1E4]|nr:helix-turn-helix transcriptional regulator [Leptolyngbya sp. SIO1E4]
MTQTLLKQPNASAQYFKKRAQYALLASVLEGFPEGTLILTVDGQLRLANKRGRQLCRQIGAFATEQSPSGPLGEICRYLVESRELFPDQNLEISQELRLDETTLQIRIQWFQIDDEDEACLMVRLEDRAQSFLTAAFYEAQQYSLTERETEVWLLKRSGIGNKEIAATLFISINTVKRHIKHIYAKREQMLELNPS